MTAGHRSPSQRRLRWIATAAIVVAVLGAAAAGAFLMRSQSNPCRAVGELVEFNDSQMQLLQSRTHSPAEDSREEPAAPPITDYQAWANGLQERAAEVTAPELAEHASRAAELADETVDVIQQFRSESLARDPFDLEPPPSATTYGEVTKEFRDEMQALQNACPHDQ